LFLYTIDCIVIEIIYSNFLFRFDRDCRVLINLQYIYLLPKISKIRNKIILDTYYNYNIFFLLKPPTTQPIVRTSQVSLSSNPDADFRYSMIYTQIGVYKGRIFAVKKVRKKSIEITREMKKELKIVMSINPKILI